jgi:glycine/D-amino acid oxidase-like deaminating enzyme
MDLIGGYPLWLIRDGLPFDYPLLDSDLETDVLVIGGGISGALVAHELVKAGIECTLIDSRTIGLGSTCGSTAFLQYELDLSLSRLRSLIGLKDATRIYRASSEAVDTLGKSCDEIGFPGYERTGSVYFAGFKKHATFLQEEFNARKNAGFDVQFLSAPEIRDRYGFSSSAAIWSSKGATVDVYLLTHKLIQHAVPKGLRVFDRTTAGKIDYQKKHVIVHSGSFKIKARLLVNATGYEAVKENAGTSASLHSTFAFATEQDERNNPLKGKELFWNTTTPYLYFRRTEDGRVLVGGRDVPFFAKGKRDQLLQRKTTQLAHDIEKLFPGFNCRPEFCWCGTFAITPDSLPYIGMHPKVPKTYYTLGFGGNGTTFSVIAAGLIRDAILGRKNPDAGLFRFDREKVNGH